MNFVGEKKVGVMLAKVISLYLPQELRGHLETCLMEGTTLVVTDVDVNELEYDSRFYYILRSRYRFLTSSNPFKLMVRSQWSMCSIR